MKKIILSIVCLTVMASVSASSAEASNWNRGKCCGTTVTQRNVSNVSTTVVAIANTGGNDTNRNWVKGSQTTTTGDATTTVSITTTTGGNVALVSGCCCNGCDGGDPWTCNVE